MLISILKKIIIIFLIVANLILVIPSIAFAVESTNNQYIWELALLIYNEFKSGKETVNTSCTLVLNGTIVYYDLERERQWDEYVGITVNGTMRQCRDKFGGLGCYQTACIQNSNEVY